MADRTPSTTQKTVASGSHSPYTVQNLDAAIAHLERVLCADALAIFGPGYWHSRIRQVEATPGLMYAQLRRLQALLERLPDVLSHRIDDTERIFGRNDASAMNKAYEWEARNHAA